MTVKLAFAKDLEKSPLGLVRVETSSSFSNKGHSKHKHVMKLAFLKTKDSISLGTVLENHLKSLVFTKSDSKSLKTTLPAKPATFKNLRFFRPFLPFENYFRPLKLCLYSKLLIENNKVAKVYNIF